MANQGPRKVSDLAANEPASSPPSAPGTDPVTLEEIHRLGEQQSRPRRRPFGSQEYKLAGYNITPGFVGRWFNDTPGRIQRALAAGYVHVKDHEGVNQELTVGEAKNGSGQRAWLMEIPQEFYDEDFAGKEERLDRIDQAIMRGKFNAEKGDRRYGEVKQRTTVGTGARQSFGKQPRRPMGS